MTTRDRGDAIAGSIAATAAPAGPDVALADMSRSSAIGPAATHAAPDAAATGDAATGDAAPGPAGPARDAAAIDMLDIGTPEIGTLDIDTLDIDALAWDKQDGLLPAIVQDADSGRVLMLGYMSREALAATLSLRLVTFHSRSRQRLWTKGERSGHALELVSLEADCDRDTLLVQARPRGPTCHLGSDSCFPSAPGDELGALQALVRTRAAQRPPGSYTTTLLEAGIKRIAQKVGEEGLETALAAVAEDDDALLGEAADLLYHLVVLLQARGLSLDAARAVLARRRG